MITLSIWDCFLLLTIGFFCLKERFIAKGSLFSLIIEQIAPYSTYLGFLGLINGITACIYIVEQFYRCPKDLFSFISGLLGGILLIVLGFLLSYLKITQLINEKTKTGSADYLALVYSKIEQEKEFLSFLALGIAISHLLFNAAPV